MRWLGFVLRFALRSFSGAMGCFIGCFRPRDCRRHHLRNPNNAVSASSPRSVKPNDVTISRNRLSSLFLSEEKEDSLRDKGESFGVGSQNDGKGLKDEAKFVGKLQLDVQPFNPPTPVKHCEEWGKGTDSSEHTPSSCISYAQTTQCGSTERSRTGSLHTSDWTENNVASVSPWPSAAYTQRKNKSVRFECGADLSSSGSSDYGSSHMKKADSPNNQSAYKPSPYPTPLMLSDEMQTPGTVYPSTLGDLPNGMPRVRSQIVYQIYNQGENVSQFKIPEEKDFNPEQAPRQLTESVEQSQNATPTAEKGLKKISYENESKEEASLSSWLKPASVILEERKKRMETAYSQIPHFRKTPADRPIIGMVAAHWNEDEDSNVPPPKWWDGNGIPNSTNKYKEDQQVNWHATPFEERLEKALSEESFVSQRKNVCGKPIAFDENEESDTALSQLQSSTHPQSVVSF